MRTCRLFYPLDNHYVFTARFFTEVAIPAGDSQVRGSNVTARYTEFDGVKVLLYEPLRHGSEALPGFVFFHGGGYIIGSAKFHGHVTRQLAEELGAVVVAIDYRLAPDHVFPAAFEDSLTATKFFLNHARDYGVDPSRVVVGGDSAGGQIAASIVQAVYDDPTLPNIKLQVLFYPWLQFIDFNTPSYQYHDYTFSDSPRRLITLFVSAYCLGRIDESFLDQLMANMHTSSEFKQSKTYKELLNHDTIFKMLEKIPKHPQYNNVPMQPTSASFSLAKYQTFYKPHSHFDVSNDTLWEEVRGCILDSRNAPLLRGNFRGLPKAFVVTGDYDSVRDDGIFYVHALEKSGVEVTWRNYLGTWHGLMVLGPLKISPTGVEMIKAAVQFIKDNI
ncbi:neutral cholesterol ester hydrolase 1-like [Diadema setosum]|uniref:neutral cholesterol ester hydrolase 1-like n=1 Tax=Diadema setosum TaxID=31175 RepID=UPI003B3BE2E1